jgi:hypothetical protein
VAHVGTTDAIYDELGDGFRTVPNALYGFGDDHLFETGQKDATSIRGKSSYRMTTLSLLQGRPRRLSVVRCGRHRLVALRIASFTLPKLGRREGESPPEDLRKTIPV